MRTWLINIRQLRGVSQKAVSDAIGVSQPTYWQYEHGMITPSVAIAKKIAAYLGFDWTLFFEDKSA
jgi:transcriptional regulator with XRE-family HTH domain